MNCIVLGGGGFLGSHLCDSLLAGGHFVRIFEKKGSSKINIKHLINKIDLKEGDFSDLDNVREALSDMDIVFHLIGTTLPQSSNDNPIYDLSSNLVATVQMLDIAKREGIKKIIFASSGGTIYGVPQVLPIPEDHPTLPICSYGIQKLAIEKYLHLYHCLYAIDYAVLRISNPYGARQSVESNQGAISIFIERALREQPIEIWGDGSIVRDFIHVSDVARAFVKSINNCTDYRLFNIGSGVGHTLRDIISEIEKEMGHQLKVTFTYARKIDVPANVLAIERASQALDWSPDVPFSMGISQMIRDRKLLS
ncbi:MAG: NAD-dependent epimerase/dehydratase family protein [Nitrospirae bacterium]|nr:NAD-dependent epimerase/dehydratase family protein [Candidatus Manganitrophaceae bacterium]